MPGCEFSFFHNGQSRNGRPREFPRVAAFFHHSCKGESFLMKLNATPPPIVISERDHERLTNLALAVEHMPGVGDYLTQELSRATILPRQEIGADLVTMYSEVQYRDNSTGETHTVTLVYPGDQDIASWKISVLTPVGAALIGLSAGQSIEWETRLGAHKSLTVLRVVRQPG
jgi:regulator of nucleoside diphosphate kinase